jgi:5-methylcytosine-specific restriction enzyme subunit McrC
MPAVALAEWQSATPQSDPALGGASIAAEERDLVEYLDRRRMITLTERRDGVAVETNSFVGSIQVGSLTIHVLPKMGGAACAALVRYGLRLPQIELFGVHSTSLSAAAFQDLLVSQLADEASRLLARGVHRSYIPEEAALASPRGRLDFDRLSMAPSTTASLPCRYYERRTDVLLNRVLLAGLRLAGSLAAATETRMAVLRPARALAELAAATRLDASTFRRARGAMNRLTQAYEPSFTLIKLLMEGRGIGTGFESEARELPGFLFDMNRLFQDAVGRFLSDWLSDGRVSAQHALRNVFGYHAEYNPRRKLPPTPRPDFVLLRAGRIAGIVDAKYRDLWQHDLPRDMLYQLSIYALSQRECPAATILYATNSVNAGEARIKISDPTNAQMRALICLRPVVLGEFAELTASPRTVTNDKRRREYARRLAYGPGTH